jgi:8-oxo-dGTP diphosphatase
MALTDTTKQAVVAIIQQSGKFLLIKRSDYIKTAKGYWCPVSGRIENDETQEEALIREVFEEVGLSVEAIEKVAEIPTHDKKFTLHFWTTKILCGEARVASHEVADIRWVTIKELDRLNPIFEEDVQILKNMAGR